MHQARASLQTLDFLRGLAAVYIVVNHTRGALFAGGSRLAEEGPLSLFDQGALALLQLTSLGQEFVILFFVLSGYAMANSVSQMASVGGFYLKRAVRIWPTYLVALALAVGVAATFAGLAGTSCAGNLCSPSRVGQIALYINPHTPLTPQFWSLPYEVLFYLFCPVLLSGKRRVEWVFALSCIGFVVGFAVNGLAFNPGGVLANFLTTELFLFMAGAMAFHHFHKLPRLSPLALAAVAFLGVLACLAVKWRGEMNLVSCLVCVAVTVLAVRNLPERLGRSRLNWGGFSYSLYAFHYAILWAIGSGLALWFGLSQSEMTSYVGWVLALPPILAVCWVLHLLTGVPVGRWMTSLRARERFAA